MPRWSTPRPSGSVADVLKGWPRISEPCIASEIRRVERAGVPLRLYVIKPADDEQTHPAKDIFSPSLNPAGRLRHKLPAARFAVTCTEANVRHLKTIAGEAAVHRVHHGLNADFARRMGEERGAWAPDPNGSNGRRRGAVRLLGVGRLVPKKGFDVMVATLFREVIA